MGSMRGWGQLHIPVACPFLARRRRRGRFSAGQGRAGGWCNSHGRGAFPETVWKSWNRCVIILEMMFSSPASRSMWSSRSYFVQPAGQPASQPARRLTGPKTLCSLLSTETSTGPRARLSSFYSGEGQCRAGQGRAGQSLLLLRGWAFPIGLASPLCLSSPTLSSEACKAASGTPGRSVAGSFHERVPEPGSETRTRTSTSTPVRKPRAPPLTAAHL